MATISKVRDLLPLLATIKPTDDVVTALEKRGHKFSSDIKKKLKSGHAPTPEQRRLWTQAARKAGKVRVTTGQSPRIAPRELSPNEYEFSAGVRMSVANQIVAGLYANGTIPNVLLLDELLSPSDIDTLQSIFIIDRPGGRIGSLSFTTAPTVTQISEGSDRVLFALPFRLNFEKIGTSVIATRRTIVTFATGVMKLDVRIVAETTVDNVGSRSVVIQLDLSQGQNARLEIDPSSPVQLVNPVPPGQIDVVAGVLQNQIQQRLGGSLRLSLSASFSVPFGRLEIARVVVLTRSDALLVGMKVVGTPGIGDPNNLVPLFPNAQTNLFTRVHDQVFRMILQRAAQSGILTQEAKKTHSDAVIDSADIAFGPNTIKLIAKGKIVDMCPFGLDVGFTVTTTVTITLEATQIKVEKETSENVDDSDAFWCAISSLGLALLAAFAALWFGGITIAAGITALLEFGFIGILSLIMLFDEEDFDLIFGDGEDDKPTIIQLDFPIPGTDLLPTLTGNFIRVDESTMLMAGQLGTRRDDLNTYFYVRFMERDTQSPVAFLTKPMKGARVRLMDRDNPAPEGDDVVMSTQTTTRTSTSHSPIGDFAITTKTHFERTADEVFRDIVADRNGRIRIYIPRDKLRSRAGTKVVETTRENLDTEEVTTTTTRSAVPEPLPDFYFRLTRTDGSSVDTLQLGSGFFKNFQSASIGTPTNPLTITFGGGTLPIVVDPGIAPIGVAFG